MRSNIVELSSKVLFQERKTDLTKEGELLLQKSPGHHPRRRKTSGSASVLMIRMRIVELRAQQVLAKYFQGKLYIAGISNCQFVTSEVRKNAGSPLALF